MAQAFQNLLNGASFAAGVVLVLWVAKALHVL